MNTDTKNEICLLALQVRTAGIQLEEMRNKEFPMGCLVYVRAPRYTGYGIASRQDGCTPDQLPVRLENGNTWWYPIEGCTRVPLADFSKVPSLVRRLKMAFHGLTKSIRIFAHFQPVLP